MSVGFQRRYETDPGLAVLTAIEGVVVIDRDPPATITGVGSGTVTLVAEFEDGPFNTPLQLAGGGDFLKTFGGFGFTRNGVPSNDPCARARKPDAALVPEAWCGNGFVAAQGKKYAALICCRVDTSVGSVTFTREASLHGAPDVTWSVATSGQHIDIDVGAGAVSVAFTGVAATLQSSAGTYPSTFTGGESLQFLIDGTTYTAFFQAADQTQAQVIARLNLAVGFAAFSDAGTGKTNITGLVPGTSGNVQILAGTASVLTATGFAVGGSPTAGTGNVGNRLAITDAEADTIIHGTVGLTAVHFKRDANGNAWLVNTGTPGTGTVKVASTSTTNPFGFPVGVTASAASGNAGTIPAGTEVRDAGGHRWVTMQTLAVTAASAGPYTVKVRPALDDGTGVSALAGAVNVVPNPIAVDAFAVVNLQPLTAALTENQLDVAYLAALGTTKATSSVVKRTNIVVSARASNAIRNALRTNAVDASSNGCYGRLAIIRPPLGTTTRAMALSLNAQPGVGAYRHQRVVYAYPGVQCYVPQIASVGAAGGFGFTDSGLIDVGFDSWVASVCSQLPPEENPGQATDFLAGILAVETGNPDVQALTEGDYENFRAGGIAAPRVDEGVSFVQSGVTSVDPLVYPNLRNIARRRMADFIQDTLAIRLMSFDKKLATLLRRALIVAEIKSFMDGLVSAKNPALQRIDGYSLDAKSGNTPDTLALGIFRIILKVRTLSSLDVIVLDTQIGESVVITEQAA